MSSQAAAPILAISLLFMGSGSAQEPAAPEPAEPPLAVAAFKEDHATKLADLAAKEAAARDKLIEKYLAAVDAEFAKFQKAGKLDQMVGLRDEKARMEKMRSFPLKRVTPMPSAVARAESMCVRGMAKISDTSLEQQLRLWEAYVARLGKLTADFTKKAKLDSAVVAQREEQGARDQLAALRKRGSAGAGSQGADRLPAALRKGLVLYMPFDRDTGKEIPDLSGNAHHGSIDSKKWFTEGIIGGGCHFDGSYSVKIEQSDDLDCKGPFTIALWFKLDHDVVELKKQQFLFSADSWTAHRGYNLMVNSPNSRTINFRVHSEAGKWPFDCVVDASKIKKDSWHHLAATASGGSMKLYIDGKSIQSIGAKGFSQPSDKGPYVGARFYGTMDEVLLFSRNLDAGEVEKLYRLGVGE